MELPDELVGIEEELEIEGEPDPDLPGETTAEGDGEDDDVERERFLSVAVGPEEFAIHVNAVRRLVDVDHWTRVPRTSSAIEGVTDLRGEITAVIDPRRLFDVPQPEERPATQELVVFATGGDDGAAGIVVDEVLGVEAVPVSHVVLEPADVDADREVVEQLLESDLVAGLLRRRGAEAPDAPAASVRDDPAPTSGTADAEEASLGRDAAEEVSLGRDADGGDAIASAVDRGLGAGAIGNASEEPSDETFEAVGDSTPERSEATDSAGEDEEETATVDGDGASGGEGDDFGIASGADAGASHEYVPVIDVDAALERASEAAV